MSPLQMGAEMFSMRMFLDQNTRVLKELGLSSDVISCDDAVVPDDEEPSTDEWVARAEAALGPEVMGMIGSC